MWALLLVTLPTQPNAVRLRIWRSLKSLGCAALRDGAYVLPSDHVAALDAIATEVREHGGSASVLALAPRDESQHREVLALFDRSEAYAQWQVDAMALLHELNRLPETDARRRLRGIADALAALQRIDYYPGAAVEQAQSELATLRGALDARFSRGEPHARAAPHAADGVARLDRAKFQGKRWATRARPWVDRLASAWLIRRFIDPAAEFVWLPADAETIRTPRGALGFDYDGARFTHVGSLVTFEVLAASFGLQQDARLQRIGALVHYLDAGGIPVAEAAGLETVLGGLRELHAHDDRLLAAAAAVFDALYASPAADAAP
jgi:hypothetical protein